MHIYFFKRGINSTTHAKAAKSPCCAAMHAKKNNTKGSKIPCLALQRMPIGRYQLLKRMPTLLFGHGAKIIIYVQNTQYTLTYNIHHVVYLELLMCWKTVPVKLHQLERGQVLSVARDSFHRNTPRNSPPYCISDKSSVALF